MINFFWPTVSFTVFHSKHNRGEHSAILKVKCNVRMTCETMPWMIKHSLLMGSAAAAKSLQSCPTLCDPIDGSPPGFPIPGILQARTLACVAISFSNAWKWKVRVKSLSRVQLSDPVDCGPPGCSVHGVLQARTLEWVAISFSNACKWKVRVKSLSRVRLFATPWTAAHQAPSSMGFSRQEYWSGLPLPSPSCFYGLAYSGRSIFFFFKSSYSFRLLFWAYWPFIYLLWEKAMATHSSVLAWRIPGTGEPGGLPSMG